MRIEIRSGNEAESRQQINLDSEAILRYLIGDDEKLETAIICKEPTAEFATTDKEVYDALASLKPYDQFKINKLTKLFENVHIKSFKDMTGNEKPVLTFEEAEALRHSTLANKKRK